MGINIEQREFERVKVCCRLEMRLPGRAAGHPEPGLSVDLSLGGVCANTTATLRLEDEVDVVIDTAQAPQALGLPHHLRARAKVRRVEERTGGWQKVALSFAPAFAQSMELAFFLAYVCGMQGEATPAMG